MAQVHCPNPLCARPLQVAAGQAGSCSCPVCGQPFLLGPAEPSPGRTLTLPGSLAGVQPAGKYPETRDYLPPTATSPRQSAGIIPAALAGRGPDQTCTDPGLTPTAPPKTPWLPARIGRFEVRERLGEGAFGVVYRAYDPQLKREVALKVAKPELMGSEQRVKRFQREAESAARLHHAHIVPVFDSGRDGAHFYIASGFMPHGSLEQNLSATPANWTMEPRRAGEVVRSLAEALAYAHGKGVIHRDVKPANVLLDESGGPQLADFGLAAREEAEEKLTQEGTRCMGTPAYMAPEQAAGGTVPASDQYSLGCTLYELLTGHTPFAGPPEMQLFLHQTRQPDSPRTIHRKVPRDLETVCLKCLEKEPAQRYANCQALADDLRRWLDGEPVTARRLGTLERLGKWARRNPALAALTAAFAFSLLLGTVVATVFAIQSQRNAARADRKAEEALANEETAIANGTKATRNAAAEKKAREQKERELTRAEGLVYAGQLTLAQQFWNADRPMAAAARDVLDACRWDYRGWEHALLRQHFDETHLTLRGDQGVMNWFGKKMALSPDGKRLALACFSPETAGRIKVWDTATGQELLAFKVQLDINSICFSPDGERLATGCSILDESKPRRVIGGAVQAWDVRTGKELFTARKETSTFDSSFRLVCFSADSKRVVTSRWDGIVQVWNAATGEELSSFETQKDGSPIFSPDARYYARLGQSGKIWDVTTGRELCSLQQSSLISQTLALHQVASFRPDGRELACACREGVKIYDAATGQIRHTLTGRKYGARYVSFSADGKLVATARDFDREVHVWEVATGKELHILRGHTNTPFVLCFSPDGKHLATGGFDETVRVWDAGSGRELNTFRGHSGPISQLFFLPDGRRIASVAQENAVKIWDLAGDNRHNLRLQIPPVYGVHLMCFNPDGIRIAGVCTIETRRESVNINGFVPEGIGPTYVGAPILKIWDQTTGQELLSLKGHQNYIRSVTFSPDGRRLVSGAGTIDPSKAGEIKVWDAQTGRELLALEGHAGSVRSVCFSPDGNHLAAGTDICERKNAFGGRSIRGEVKVWDATTGRGLSTFKVPTAGVTSLSYSPDGKLLASGGYDLLVRVWDVATGQVVHTLQGHSSSVYDVRFSPNGKRIASASGIPVPLSANRYMSGEVIVWDVATGREMLTLKGHTANVWAVCFSPDGKRLASASRDMTVKVWDATTGQDLLTLDGFRPDGASISFSPDGKRLAYPSGWVKIWDTALGQERLVLENYPTDVRSVGFSADGERIVLQTRQGKVRAWNATSGREVRPCPDAAPVKEAREAVNAANTLRLTTDGTEVRVVRVGDDRPSSDLVFARRMNDPRLGLLWHRNEAETRERSREWFAAAFHLRQLLSYGDPDAPQLQKRLKACENKLKKP